MDDSIDQPRIKVYGWLADAPVDSQFAQVRMIVAAYSRDEVARLTRSKSARSKSMFRLGVTKNPQEIEAATRQPGVVLWKPLDKYSTEWTRL